MKTSLKDSSPSLLAEDSDSDHWALNAVQASRMTLIIVSLSTNHDSALCLFSETIMDTRVATAELGWTAYPNSGVSLSLPKRAQSE